MASPGLRSTTAPLARVFDVALLDLDGVVYVGRSPVSGAAASLAAARGQGMRLAFVTNNAARPPAAVAERLRAMGVPADPREVVTSAQAAAHYLADRLPAGSAVLVVGTSGLREALTERGLRPVSSADDGPAAVVQGFAPNLAWPQLAEGAVGIRRGLPWIATNLDPTVPSERGPLPGNGSLVAALRHATGAEPTATGKPDPTMHRESVQRSRAQHPLVVGDRLDTDIAGAAAVGCPSLLVLTGVTTAADLIAAPAAARPDFLARDVSGLLRQHAAPVTSEHAGTGSAALLGRWRGALRADGQIMLTHVGSAETEPADTPPAGDGADDLDCLRVLCASAWAAASEGTARDWHCAAGDDRAAEALESLGLH